MSPATGENAFTVTLTLVTRACSVRGYPRVRLLDQAGMDAPFSFVRGKGQYVSNRPARWVNLRPGQRIYTEIAKYRCDTTSFQRVKSALIGIRGNRLHVRVPRNVNLTYCGRHDPGSVVQLAALRAHEADVFPAGSGR